MHPIFAEGRHRSDMTAGTAPATMMGGEKHLAQGFASVRGGDAAVTHVCRTAVEGVRGNRSRESRSAPATRCP